MNTKTTSATQRGTFVDWLMSAQTLGAFTVVWLIVAIRPGDEFLTLVSRLIGGIASPVCAYLFVGALLRELRNK